MENTIGYLTEEHESFLAVWYILFGSLIYIIFGSILEGLFFYLYNKSFHPFKNILESNEDIELNDIPAKTTNALIESEDDEKEDHSNGQTKEIEGKVHESETDKVPTSIDEDGCE